jgi:hypothetical protein
VKPKVVAAGFSLRCIRDDYATAQAKACGYSTMRWITARSDGKAGNSPSQKVDGLLFLKKHLKSA